MSEQELEVPKEVEQEALSVDEYAEKDPDEAKPEEPKPATRAGDWVPKTELGMGVINGKYPDINAILDQGHIILEPEIVDYLIPDLKVEVIYIGGTPGKGGGIKRTATKMTTRMHKSGRRYTISAMAVVGDEKNIIGIGASASGEHRIAIQNAEKQAKLNVFKIKKGCGSWECGCNVGHSIPFAVKAKFGSVVVELKPAPKGVGIVSHDAGKKVIQLAGIKDVWVKTRGQTGTRSNLACAIISALKKLSTTKGDI